MNKDQWAVDELNVKRECFSGLDRMLNEILKIRFQKPFCEWKDPKTERDGEEIGIEETPVERQSSRKFHDFDVQYCPTSYP